MKLKMLIALAITLGFSVPTYAGFLDKVQRELQKADEKINDFKNTTQETVTSVNDTIDSAEDSVNSMVTGSIPSRPGSRSNPYATPTPSGLPDLATGYDLFGMDLGYYTKQQLQTALSSTQMGTYINDRRYQINMPASNISGTELVGVTQISANLPSGLGCSSVADKAISKYINGSTSSMDVYSGREQYSWGGSNVDKRYKKNAVDINQFKNKVASFSGSGQFRLSGVSDATQNGSGMNFEISCHGGVTQQVYFHLNSGKLPEITQYNLNRSMQQRKATAQATPTPDF